MKRVGRWACIKSGCEQEYERWHRQVWPGVLEAIRAARISRYSIYRLGNQLFSYFEVKDLEAATAVLEADPECQRWQAAMGPLMEASDPLAPWVTMREVFHLD